MISSFPAHAELIAFYQQALNKQDGIIVELSNLQRGLAQKEVSICEKQGMRMAFISATNVSISPETVPYASGCWHYSNGNVVISAETLRDRKTISLSFAAKRFTTTPEFSRWQDYIKNSPFIRKPLTQKEQEALEVIAESYQVTIKNVFDGSLRARLTDTFTAQCSDDGEKKALISGCVANTGRCVTTEACWAYRDGDIYVSGIVHARDTDIPFSTRWDTKEFSPTENFVNWDGTRSQIPVQKP